MLEETRRTLERLLEEETQAKRDEEIVRNLQGRYGFKLSGLLIFTAIKKFEFVRTDSLCLLRVLREEMEHREKLERLQEEQKALLESEREKRMEFEKQQKDKEAQLLGRPFIYFI